ncbi:Replication factor A protein 1 [Linderina macrospora]|uniref:Replication factor A protein 1 n=1 Tax=Linderina macrospora TaxID=4868 RepID=A0ACC1J8M8_9FUNG|nr:Replication factor A protein 1 [Linderina macrospora]
MDIQLTQGALERLSQSPSSSSLEAPLVLQVVSRLQPIPSTTSGGTATRYRSFLSDGQHSTVAILTGRLTKLIDDNVIARHTVLNITRGSASMKEGRPGDKALLVLIVLDAEVVATLDDRIGDPVKIGPDSSEEKPDVSNAAAQQRKQPAAPMSSNSPSFMSRVDGNRPNAGSSSMSGFSGPTPAVTPIASLNPYNNKWTIRARVSQKSPVREWNKDSGSGKLFSVNLIDESGEIRATIFTRHVDEYLPVLEVGKVFYITQARVTMARRQFSNVNNEYELVFEDSTEVMPCTDAVAALPQVHYSFLNLSDLGKYQKDHLTDILCVVRQASELSTFVSQRTQKEMTKRDLMVVDKSGYEVRLTLWGDQAMQFDASNEPVVAFKGLRLGDYGGRTLSLPSMGSYTVNPDIPEAHALRGWYDQEGRQSTFQSYSAGAATGGDNAPRYESQLKTMEQVREETTSLGDNQMYCTMKGTVVFVRNTSIAYPACSSPDCNKKVIEDPSTGQWRCEKCQKSFPAPNHRFLFAINVSDETGQSWLQCFNDIGEQLFGCTANEMIQWQEMGDAMFQKKIEEATFKEFVFRCRAKNETYNDNTRVRFTVMNLTPVDYVTETRRLARLVESYA